MPTRAERREARAQLDVYAEALRHERAGLVARGLTDRVDQVDAELERVAQERRASLRGWGLLRRRTAGAVSAGHRRRPGQDAEVVA